MIWQGFIQLRKLKHRNTDLHLNAIMIFDICRQSFCRSNLTCFLVLKGYLCVFIWIIHWFFKYIYMYIKHNWCTEMIQAGTCWFHCWHTQGYTIHCLKQWWIMMDWQLCLWLTSRFNQSLSCILLQWLKAPNPLGLEEGLWFGFASALQIVPNIWSIMHGLGLCLLWFPGDIYFWPILVLMCGFLPL